MQTLTLALDREQAENFKDHTQFQRTLPVPDKSITIKGNYGIPQAGVGWGRYAGERVSPMVEVQLRENPRQSIASRQPKAHISVQNCDCKCRVVALLRNLYTLVFHHGKSLTPSNVSFPNRHRKKSLRAAACRQLNGEGTG